MVIAVYAGVNIHKELGNDYCYFASSYIEKEKNDNLSAIILY